MRTPGLPGVFRCWAEATGPDPVSSGKGLCPLTSKQRVQIHRLGHGPVAGISGVQVVTGIKGSGHPRRLRRVAQGRTQVDHRIEGTVLAQPVVQLAAQRVLVCGVVVLQRRAGQGAGERQQGRAEDAQAVAAGLLGQCPIAGLQLAQGRVGLVAGEGRARPADVVDADQHDHAGHTGLVDHVALEAGEGGCAHAIAQQAAAGNAGIDHGHATRGQTGSQMVGPALVLVQGGGGAIGDRIANDYDAARAGRCFDVDPRQHHARRGGAGVVQRARRALVARRDPAGLPAFPVEGLQWGRPGQVGTDLQLLQVAGRQCERIAQALLARRDAHARLTIETQGQWRRTGLHRHAGRIDLQRLRAVGVAQPHPQARPAQAEAGGLAEGLVFQLRGQQCREQEARPPHRLRAGLPAGEPMAGAGRFGIGGAGQGDQGSGGKMAKAVHRWI